MSITDTAFGVTGQRAATLFTLEQGDLTVSITDYGGTVTSILAPDASGRRGEVVCGFDSLDGYLSDEYRSNSPYFGCVVGRYAGRIKDGRFSVGGNQFQLATNDGANHLHGGVLGFDKRVWEVVEASESPEADRLTLGLTSPDGEEGYPGNVNVRVEYELTSTGEFRIRYLAETDAVTPLSLTNHTYFNLNGFTGSVLDHVVTLKSDRYLVPDESNVPTGGDQPVAGTAADFNTAKRLGDAFQELPLGFEHYYLFEDTDDALRSVAEIYAPSTGRRLDVATTEPGALFYTGRYTSKALRRESGDQYGPFRGFCLETSKYPNGPNIVGSPRSWLDPAESYREETTYTFGVI
ncbi:MAG: aldose epimerase family protein [Planctomycetota bacterium]